MALIFLVHLDNDQSWRLEMYSDWQSVAFPSIRAAQSLVKALEERMKKKINIGNDN